MQKSEVGVKMVKKLNNQKESLPSSTNEHSKLSRNNHYSNYSNTMEIPIVQQPSFNESQYEKKNKINNDKFSNTKQHKDEL